MGHELTVNGIRPDPRKVDAIMKMPQPTDKAGVRRLLGMATYLSRYCANFSEVTAPLREENAFMWNDRHDAAFRRLCTMLSSPPVLQFYDVTKPITVETDCSLQGIGSVALQGGQPIEYA